MFSMMVGSVGKPPLSNVPWKIYPDVMVTEAKADGWYLYKTRKGRI